MNVLWLNNCKTEQVTSAKFLEFILYVEAIIYITCYIICMVLPLRRSIFVDFTVFLQIHEN